MEISKRLIEVSNLHAGEVAELLEAAASEIDLLRDEKADLQATVSKLKAEVKASEKEGAMSFACWIIDNAEREYITEEFIQQQCSDFIRSTGC
jgi:cell division septum initiation protein DivIVA